MQKRELKMPAVLVEKGTSFQHKNCKKDLSVLIWIFNFAGKGLQ